jgi:hypothetical protein
MKTIKDFTLAAIDHITNDYGEIRNTKYNEEDHSASIICDNGWVISIVRPSDDTKIWSVAVCDINGYFDWNILRNNFPGKSKEGLIYCKNEKEVCEAIEDIQKMDENIII